MIRATCLLALLLAACSNSPAAKGDAYQRGLTALAAGDARTARVEFLNAIDANPRNAAAHVMQARVYLKLEDGIAAEAEIARARALGVPVDRTRALMAHALLLQQRMEPALHELKGSSGPYAERIKGRTLAAMGKNGEAASAFAAALALAPSDSETWTELARFRRANGELVGALQAVDKAVAIDSRNVEALVLRGELTRSQYGLRAALPWFDRAIELDKHNVTARLERAATLGDLGEMRAMLGETRKVLGLSNNNPMAFYLQAMLAARAGKFTLARSLYERTGGKLDVQPSAMLLAGAIEYQTGNSGQAIKHLSRLIELQPDNRKARRLLAAAWWQSGDAAATVRTLRPLADQADADTYILNLMGNALAKLGDGPGASLYLTRAARPQERAAAALIADQADPATLALLRADASARPGEAPVQVKLIRALLSAGLGDEALQRARALQAANPGAPETHILVGDALGIRGQFAAAADQYRKAANIAFSEPTALRMIEALERSGQGQAAARVLALFLEQNPRSVPAQLLAATRYMQVGQWSGAIAAYERLRRQIGDSDAVMLNNLAWAYSERRDYARALPLARKAWLLDRDNPATADTYGWLLFKSGRNRAGGLSLLQRAAKGAPSDVQIRKHLAQAKRG